MKIFVRSRSYLDQTCDRNMQNGVICHEHRIWMTLNDDNVDDITTPLTRHNHRSTVQVCGMS